MNDTVKRPLSCDCGASIDLPLAGDSSRSREIVCGCGRWNILEITGDRWSVAGVLTPEGSVPISGFSLGLRQRPDVQRFWFRHALAPAGQLIVHIVFSPGSEEAEVKAADLKAAAFSGVQSPADARGRWIALDRRRTSYARASRRSGRNSGTATV